MEERLSLMGDIIKQISQWNDEVKAASLIIELLTLVTQVKEILWKVIEI